MLIENKPKGKSISKPRTYARPSTHTSTNTLSDDLNFDFWMFFEDFSLFLDLRFIFRLEISNLFLFNKSSFLFLRIFLETNIFGPFLVLPLPFPLTNLFLLLSGFIWSGLFFWKHKKPHNIIHHIPTPSQKKSYAKSN